MLRIQIERKTNEFEAFPASSLEVELENHAPSFVVVRVSGEADSGQAGLQPAVHEALTRAELFDLFETTADAAAPDRQAAPPLRP
jgi:hypothetical protein